ncbi:MAG: LPS-assembly protein LptD, partial [Hyphomicrobiales bacterium]|nr:LPS-assembly protein LptD [Hyphomicrobiales bacterium]
MARLLGATAMVCVIAYAAVPLHAQSLDVDQAVPSGSQMLLEADTLVYDQDMSTVTAVGGVQIEYGGNNLVAERVIYNRQTGRLLAVGKVEIVDQDGTKFYADEIDITDD